MSEHICIKVVVIEFWYAFNYSSLHESSTIILITIAKVTYKYAGKKLEVNLTQNISCRIYTTSHFYHSIGLEPLCT